MCTILFPPPQPSLCLCLFQIGSNFEHKCHRSRWKKRKLHNTSRNWNRIFHSLDDTPISPRTPCKNIWAHAAVTWFVRSQLWLRLRWLPPDEPTQLLNSSCFVNKHISILFWGFFRSTVLPGLKLRHISAISRHLAPGAQNCLVRGKFAFQTYSQWTRRQHTNWYVLFNVRAHLPFSNEFIFDIYCQNEEG